MRNATDKLAIRRRLDAIRRKEEAAWRDLEKIERCRRRIEEDRARTTAEIRVLRLSERAWLYVLRGRESGLGAGPGVTVEEVVVAHLTAEPGREWTVGDIAAHMAEADWKVTAGALRVALQRAQENGSVQRVARGLYVAQATGRAT